MQRVVRSTLVGLLTIAGLTACGDKVTVPPQQTTPVGTVVHSVTVSPASLSLAVGGSATLAASVDADAGVTNRTVTWTSSDITVATVGTDGKVTGVKAGTVTITAASAADPTVKGAAAVTIGGAGGGGVPTVTIASVNQTNGAGQSVPANLAGAAGQLDVIVNVDAGGQTLKSVSVVVKVGTDSMVQTQTISSETAFAAEAAASTITFSFNTAQFNATTGVPSLHNGQATITASATTNAATPQTASTTVQFTLANVDGVVLTTAMSGATASDGNGQPWKAGSATVSVLPVLYSGRVPATITITLPGATNPTQAVTAATSGATSATWSGTASSGSRITNLQLTGGVDVNGFPVGVHPIVLIVDSNGNDLSTNPLGGLAQLNSTSQSDVRIDNQAPLAPTVFTIPTPVSATNATGMNGWVNAAYPFTGAANRYTSGGDFGVSAGAVSGTSGLPGTTTLTFWEAPAATYTFVGGAAGPSTGVGPTACATTGLTQIATGGDLAPSSTNTAYRVRVNETDKLGNVRCTDLGAPGGIATFGVDKAAPVDSFATASAPDHYIANIANAGAIAAYTLVKSDTGVNSSGFTATPALTTVTRLYPGVSGAAACIIGSYSSSTCNVTSTIDGLPIDGNGNAAPGNEGYYTYTSTIRDQAQNAGATLTRTALVDITAPVMGGVSVPASITGGSSATFATSATDNLDLVSSNYTLAYGTNIANPPAGSTRLAIRTPGPSLGTAFDNVLTTSASFNVAIPLFIRNIQVTNGTDNPVALALPANQPTAIVVRALDAAGNAGTSGDVTIQAANVVETGAASFAGLAGFNTWAVANAASNLCNASPCVTAGAASSVTITAAATGTLSTFQLPFTQVQFYYFDGGYAGASNEWILIAATGGSSVTDNAGIRTFSWTTSFTAPRALGTGVPLSLMAVGLNTNGDALASQSNNNITLVP